MERNEKDFEFLIEDLENFKKFVKTFDNNKFEDFDIIKIDYGLGSYVFKVTHRISNYSVLFRKFFKDKNKEKIKKENSTFLKMSKLGIGPGLIGMTDDYRIEEFIDSRVIKSGEINEIDLRRKLAVILGTFHKVKIEGIESIDDNNLDFITKLLNNKDYIKLFEKNSNTNQNIYNEKENKFINEMYYLIDEEERTFILNLIHSHNYSFVLSHNDIWVGNILLQEKERNVTLIDYEAVDLNFPGYDIGKLLLEPMYKRREPGPEYDLQEDLMPNENEIIDFIRFYLISYISEDNLQLVNLNEEKLIELENKLYHSELDKENQLKNFLKHVYLGMMISGYYCALIGMIVGKNPNLPLDFLKFANDGHLIYKKYKKLFVE